MNTRFYLTSIFAVLLSSIAASAQTGGQFTITQSVVANGGGTSSGGNFTAEGTSGQTVAGSQSNGATFTIRHGFWTPDQFAPTAAEVSVSGRILTANGSGVRNVLITVTDGNGLTRTSFSTTLGYFRFENLSAGETYVFTVFSRRFQFAEPTRILTVLDVVDDLNFTAIE